jgi:hypothetical protein
MPEMKTPKARKGINPVQHSEGKAARNTKQKPAKKKPGKQNR